MTDGEQSSLAQNHLLDRADDLQRKLESITVELSAAEKELGVVLRRTQDLTKRLDGLTIEYEIASGEVRTKSSQDLNYLHKARQESERLLTLIRGGSLFGRYHADADEHAKAANRWRWLSLAVLVLWASVTCVLLYAKVITAPIAALLIPPFLVLFFYCSLESNGHRQREANRRRIALRMAAIESYTTQNLEKSDARPDSLKLMDDFIREHFIKPELDQTDLPYLGPGASFSLLHISQRESKKDSTSTTSAPGT